MQSDDLYLALGDSTGVGVGAKAGGYPERVLRRLREVRQSARLLNLCQSGATSLDVLQGQVPEAAQLRPALITLGIGINDVAGNEMPEAFRRNLEDVALALKGLGAPVVVCNIPDLAFAPAVARLVPPAFFERRIEVMNRHLEATAARHGFALADLFGQSRQALAQHPEYFSADGFHPSDAGYEAWAEIVWPPVQALVTRREPRSALS